MFKKKNYEHIWESMAGLQDIKISKDKFSWVSDVPNNYLNMQVLNKTMKADKRIGECCSKLLLTKDVNITVESTSC